MVESIAPVLRLMFRATRPILVALPVLYSLGCATTPLPAPENDSSSLVIVGLRIEFQSAMPLAPRQTDYAVGALVLSRIDKAGTSGPVTQTDTLANYPNGQLYLFANVAPGTYQVDHFMKPLPGLVSENHPDYNLKFTFPSSGTTPTAVRVPPRSIVYLGEFSGRYRQRTVPPPLLFRYDVFDTSGQRTASGKSQAIEVFTKRQAGSPWATYPVAP